MRTVSLHLLPYLVQPDPYTSTPGLPLLPSALPNPITPSRYNKCVGVRSLSVCEAAACTCLDLMVLCPSAGTDACLLLAVLAALSRDGWEARCAAMFAALARGRKYVRAADAQLFRSVVEVSFTTVRATENQEPSSSSG